ncbi:MAG: ribosomal L7Ae/L30e/S12e/Gadd45 family protein [Nanoarchaeota archaeon]|mgnify:CR=1 FL=1
MAKKISSAEIKKLIKSGNFIIGTEKSVKQLKLGKVEKVLVSLNCPASVEKKINYYAALNSTEVHKLEYPNDELGVLCKKPFSISVLSFLKVAK